LASTLKDLDDEVEGNLTGHTLLGLPGAPVKNLDFKAHGRNPAIDACVVTAAISFTIKIPANYELN